MNENLQPVPDEHLEARITAYILGESSAFEAAEIEALIANSPELTLFANRTRTLNQLLKEAETTANSPDTDWKLTDKKRRKIDHLLGATIAISFSKKFRIRRASFRAALGIAAILILTLILFQTSLHQRKKAYQADRKTVSYGPLAMADNPPLTPRVKLSSRQTKIRIKEDEISLADNRRDRNAASSPQTTFTLPTRNLGNEIKGSHESAAQSDPFSVAEDSRPIDEGINADHFAEPQAAPPTTKENGRHSDTDGFAKKIRRIDTSRADAFAAHAIRSKAARSVSSSVRLLGQIPVVDELLQKSISSIPDLSEESLAAQNPFSTFSLNISDASFQIALAAVEKGERPDPTSIKPEQFYNAVDYGDPAPSSLEPVAAAIDQTAHPVIPGRNLVRIAVRTASTGRSAAQPLRLTLLVDQSGSMVREDRRAAMETALNQLATLLTENDQITVIGFSRTPRLLADSLPGNEAGKLSDLVNQTANEGGTNIEQAFNLASELALRHKLLGAQNRIVLFTDGAANLGDADPDRLATRIKDLRQQDISFDIAGIGTSDTNDRLLAELARHGNGRYYLVGENTAASIATQLAGAFRPAAGNVKIQVKLNPERVGNYKLIGFEKDRLKTEDFLDDSVDAAELAADEAGVAIYQIEPLPEGTGEIGEVSVRFRKMDTGEMVERTWTIPYDPSAPAFDKAAPKTQLATLSLLAAQKLQPGPLADAIDFNHFATSIARLKNHYSTAPKAQQMLTLIDALK